MGFKNLTDRENQIVQLIIYDSTSVKEMADKLIVSTHTVKTHLLHIFEKLNVHSRYELLQLVILDLSRQLETKGELND